VLLLPEVGLVPDRHCRVKIIFPLVERQGADSSKGREINLHHDTRGSSGRERYKTTMIERQRDQPAAAPSLGPYSSDDVLLLPEVGVVPDRHSRRESSFPWIERQGADSSKGRQINLHHDTRVCKSSACGGGKTARTQTETERSASGSAIFRSLLSRIR